MQKKKVTFMHSMRFRLMSLLVGGILLTAVVLLGVSLSQTQKSIRSIVQSYMLTTAKDNGTIMDTVLDAKGAEVLNDADVLSGLLANVKVEDMESSYAYLVSADGTMLYHPTADKIGSPVENEVVTALVADLKGGKIADPACVEYNFKGVIKYAAYYINPQGSYILVVSADQSDAFSAVTQTRNYLIGMLLAILVVFSAIGLFLINHMVKPLHTLTGVVERVAALDLTPNGEEEVLARRKDEIGLIAKSIRDLNIELREIVRVIQDQGNKLSESNVQFTQGFSEIVETVSNVNVAVLGGCAAGIGAVEEYIRRVNDLSHRGSVISGDIQHFFLIH